MTKKIKDPFKDFGNEITNTYKDIKQDVSKAGELGINSVKTSFQKAADVAVTTANKTETYANNVIFGVGDYPPGVRDIIQKYGSQNITSLQVARAPVPKAITTALNVVSGGTFDSGMKSQPYDKLFHLFMYLTLQSGTKILFEKNAQINSGVNPSLPPDTETKPVPINQTLTMNQFLDNGKKQMGKSFFPYDPHYNNCQDFILGVLDGNKLTTPDVRDFIKQDTGQLFANNKVLGTIAKGVTSFGGMGERLINGYGYKNISSKKYNMKYNRDSDSDTDSESDGEGEIINKISKLKRQIKEHHQLHGGKINIAKAFKSLGSTVKKGFVPVEHYVTAKKGGLSSELVNQGIPGVTGALAGAAGGYFGGPVGGFAAGQLGSMGGRYAASAIDKAAGTGMKRGRGRPRKCEGGKLKNDLVKAYNKVVPKSLQPAVNNLAGQVGNYALNNAGYGKPIPVKGGKLKMDLVKAYNKVVPKSMQPAVNNLAGQVGNYALDKAGYGTPIPVKGSGVKRSGRMVKGSAEAMAWAEKMRNSRRK